MRVKWFGQAAYAIEYDDCRVLIDPWIRQNPVCPTKDLDELGSVDSILVSHGHYDHFGDTIELMERSEHTKLVCDPEISWYMHPRGYERNKRLFPLAQGGAVTLDSMRVSMVPAIHPSGIYGEEWLTEKKWFPNSSAVGFVLEREGAPTLYHAGDTALFSDMSLIAKRYKPKVALLPIGGRFTMDAIDAVEAVGFLRSKYIIPMHYNTNPELIADAFAFKAAVQERFPETTVIVLNPGEEHTFDLEEER